MAKRLTTTIGPRDIELLTALDRCPLTVAQLCRLSQTFEQPFGNEHLLRRRLRRLAKSELVRSWPYEVASLGRSQHYFKLTRGGYRLLYGEDVALPKRRYFEAIAAGHHHHTQSLAEFLVRLLVTDTGKGSRCGTCPRELRLSQSGRIHPLSGRCLSASHSRSTLLQLLSGTGQRHRTHPLTARRRVDRTETPWLRRPSVAVRGP
ncbi:MAG: hypothetical protein R3C02_18835 [Planctomycetaceae bacterium]